MAIPVNTSGSNAVDSSVDQLTFRSINYYQNPFLEIKATSINVVFTFYVLVDGVFEEAMPGI
jgi:hypothetical protein